MVKLIVKYDQPGSRQQIPQSQRITRQIICMRDEILSVETESGSDARCTPFRLIHALLPADATCGPSSNQNQPRVPKDKNLTVA